MSYLHTAIGATYWKPTLDSPDMDGCIWYDAYFKGYRQPNYPMPAIRYSIEYAVAYTDMTENNPEVFACCVFKDNEDCSTAILFEK